MVLAYERSHHFQPSAPKHRQKPPPSPRRAAPSCRSARRWSRWRASTPCRRAWRPPRGQLGSRGPCLVFWVGGGPKFGPGLGRLTLASSRARAWRGCVGCAARQQQAKTSSRLPTRPRGRAPLRAGAPHGMKAAMSVCCTFELPVELLAGDAGLHRAVHVLGADLACLEWLVGWPVGWLEWLVGGHHLVWRPARLLPARQQ